MAAWIEASDYRALGYAREVYLERPPHAPDRRVTELQAPITQP